MNRTILDEHVTCTQIKEGWTWRGRRVDNEFKNHETQLPGKIHNSSTSNINLILSFLTSSRTDEVALVP